MDTYQGDLTDIVRAGAGPAAISGDPDWTEPMSMDMFQEPVSTTPPDGFGNPFASLRDPLLHSGFSSSASGALLQGSPTTGRFLGVGGHVLGTKILDDRVKPPSFSQMLQISTPGGVGKLAASPCGSPMVGGGGSPSDMIINGNSSNSTGQISSPRNPGIKRRKSQAKKVVCIPAPASPNSRPTGEIVPSDLWAWRKYGQKPIKGSPYPRGYYRCSSSKGCPARKQVERSRTDPNMLVITYTSEHNHPWPTQRNALAGSTRAQPSKNTSANSKSSPISSQPHKMATAKEDQNDVASVKEEMHDMEVEENRFSTDHWFPYKPAMSEQDSFFADLDEIDTNPMHLLFTQGFSGDSVNHDDHSSERKDQTKGLDEQFSLFDWSVGNKGL